MATMTIEKTDFNDPLNPIPNNHILVSDTTTEELHIVTGSEPDHITVSQLTGDLLVETFAGNDFIELSNVTGNVEVHAGSGNDYVIIHTPMTGYVAIYGNEGDDLLVGGPSSEHLFGGPGDDVLVGAGGADVLEGGNNTGYFKQTIQGMHITGGDHLWGGYGEGASYDGESNIFVFRNGNGAQTIHDFQINVDRIEIHGYIANDTHFVYQGQDTFIRFSDTAGILVLNAHLNADNIDWVTPYFPAETLFAPPAMELEDASHQSLNIVGTFIAMERDSGDFYIDNDLKITIEDNPIVRLDGHPLCPCDTDEMQGLIEALTNPYALSFTELTSDAKQMEVSYDYSVPDLNLDFLTEGQELTISYEIRVSSYKAYSPTQELTFTIIGTNDIPSITGTHTGEVKEDNALNAITQVSGALVINDLDAGENFFQLPLSDFDSQNEWTYTLKTVLPFDTEFRMFDNDINDFKEKTMPNMISKADLAVSTDVVGSYGTFNFDTTGAWTYTLDNSVGSATDQLQEGEVVHDTLTVVSFDGSASEVIDITVIGTNDLPVIGGDVTGNITEGDGVSVNTISGQMTIADPDHDESSFVVEGNLVANYGVFTFDSTGAWTYTVNDTEGSAVDRLAEGEVLNDQLSVNSFDGSSPMVLEITITGTNDLPIIGGTSTGDVKEDGTPGVVTTTSGVLTIDDMDNGESSFLVPENLQGEYGSFAFDSSGAWVYTLDSSEGSATEALGEGVVVHDFLTVMSFDNTTETTIDVTVTGTNNVPLITGDTTGLVVEDNVPGAVTTVFGSLAITDPDTDESSFQLPGEPLVFEDVLPGEVIEEPVFNDVPATEVVSGEEPTFNEPAIEVVPVEVVLEPVEIVVEPTFDGIPAADFSAPFATFDLAQNNAF